MLQCHLAAHLHLPPAQVRRLPLALAQLWCNYAAQADGMETWWPQDTPEKAPSEAVDAHIAALRAQAAEDAAKAAEDPFLLQEWEQ